jgi:carboxymethylenebutenolidase
MEIRSEYVELKVSDGTTMQAWTARPTAAGSLPGLLVFQEAFGVNAHIRDVTQRFAREGFVAIAPELFHRTAPGFEGDYNAFPTVVPHINALKDDQMEADQRAFLAGLTLPLGCATSYYGGGIAPRGNNPGLLTRAKDLRCPVLLFWGGQDKHLTQDMVRAVRDALSDAGKNFINVEFSDADHGFFCDARSSYNPTAAAEAWPLTLAFLRLRTARAAAATR